MTNQNNQDLHYPHPGEILKTEFLDELGITQYRLAVDTKIPHSRVTAIIKGRRSVSADTALRLARYFGNSPEFWLGLQQDYDLRNLQSVALLVEEEVTPYGVQKRAAKKDIEKHHENQSHQNRGRR